MKTHYAIVLVLAAGCGKAISDEGSASSISPVKSLLAITHDEGDSPTGALMVNQDGSFEFHSYDACALMKGKFSPLEVTDLKIHVRDKNLDKFRTKGKCEPDKYEVSTDQEFICLGADAHPAGDALKQVFTDTAKKIKWDGMKKDCTVAGNPAMAAPMPSMNKKTDPPPPSGNTAGSGG